jgi:pre-mRNA-splicing factor CDC5/CEF1
VKTRLEAEREKALRLEKKVNVLTQGYQVWFGTTTGSLFGL